MAEGGLEERRRGRLGEEACGLGERGVQILVVHDEVPARPQGAGDLSDEMTIGKGALGLGAHLRKLRLKDFQVEAFRALQAGQDLGLGQAAGHGY